MEILAIDQKAPPSQQFICLTNSNPFAVDITGWKIAGSGIQHRFRPGTVVPVGKAIYIVADTAHFRSRSAAPSGNQRLFIQGNWKGILLENAGKLHLVDAKMRTVSSKSVSTQGKSSVETRP